MSGNRYSLMPAGMEDDDEEEDDFSKDLSIRKTCENMKITIIPDITSNAGLNGQSFDSNLEQDVREWFDQLKSIWFTYKRGPTLSHKLLSFFASCSNPFLYSLKFYANCTGINSPKNNSLAYAILEDLYNYKKSNQIISSHYVNDNLKMVAFNFVKKQGQQNLFKIIVNTFDLIDSKYLFVDKIKELIQQHFYKEACQLACELQLYEEFTIYEIILPLILQDKISIAEEYLNKATHLQRPLIELLDSLLDKSTTLQHRCSYYISKYDYTDVKVNKLQTKPLTKLIARLVKNYNIPTEAMPNVIKMKNYGALQFLLHKKYFEKSLNKDSWQEMVKETVPPSSFDLQIELIVCCSYNRDYSEGAFWANYFNIPIEKLPPLVQDYIQQGEHQSTYENTSVDWDNADENNASEQNSKLVIHILSLPESNIILVDNREKFCNMLRYLSTQHIIAFDAEWKPTFCATNEVALIQLATKNKIYLIDVILLPIGNDEWNQLGKHVFNNNEILKLGFSPSTDLSMFQKTIPGLSLSSLSLTSYLDLQELWRKLNNVSRFKFPYEGDIQGTALSSLVRLCLGKKLDKSNQFSNWEKRPLRKDQLIYAALDAYCLIEIYDVIETQVNNIGADFNDLINNFLTEKKSKIVLKKNHNNGASQKKINKTVPKGPNSNPVSASDVKFVCDVMLEGLAKALRKCGIDALAINGKDDVNQCIRTALRDKRFILTRGSFYSQCSTYLPLGHCYNVNSDIVDNQLEEVITYYNISVKEENVFSRCQICNGNEFVSASKAQINEMSNALTWMPSSSRHDDSSSVHTNQINGRTWRLENISTHALNNGVTSKGVKIQLSTLSSDILNSVQKFYICEECGKCYWDGTHLDKVLSGKMKNILSQNKK